jgi:type IV pilus assembly protein PilB
MAGRIRIGEILVRAGVIDQHQLNAALGEQRRWGKPLGATLVKLGFVEERDLVRGLASQLALPVASLEGKRIASAVLDLVPADMAQEYMVLPLFAKKDGRRTTLFLAMEDPGDLAVMDDLAFRTGMQVKPVMMAPSELAEGIDRYYRDRKPSEPEVPVRAVRRAHDEVVPTPRGQVPSSQAMEDAPALPANGTEELVRHFKPVVEAEPERPRASVAKPAAAHTTPSPAEPRPQAARIPAGPALEASPQAPAAPDRESVLGEGHLASPPPRKPLAEGEEALTHPPIESLASYDAKTRTILHALTHLLIEKGVITREEIHDRVTSLTAIEPS